MAAKPENLGGNQGGRFRPGQSGNPTGKPKGARHRITVMAEKLMEGSAESVVQSVLSAAEQGDMIAARLVLERIAPVRKGRPVSLPLPAVNTAGDVLAALSTTIKAMGEGRLTPDEAATVVGVLEVKRRAIETAELEKRIIDLEERASK